MAAKLLQYVAGGARSILNAVAASAGSGDAGKIAQLNASGLLDPTMLPIGLTSPTPTIAVNLTNSGASSTGSLSATSGPYSGQINLAPQSAGTSSTVLATVTTNWPRTPNAVILFPIDTNTAQYGTPGYVTVRAADITSTGFSLYMTAALYAHGAAGLKWSYLAW